MVMTGVLKVKFTWLITILSLFIDLLKILTRLLEIEKMEKASQRPSMPSSRTRSFATVFDVRVNCEKLLVQ